MRDHDDLRDRDILKLTRLVAQVQPSMHETQQALLAARHALEQREIDQRRHRRKRWIIMTTSGIAAAIITGVALFFVATSPQTASAAERLEEVAKANEAYRGWVHMTGRGLDFPNAPKEFTTHSNTSDGTFVRDDTFHDGRRQVKLWRPSNREEVTYDSQTRKIRIGTLSEEFAKNWAKEMQNQPFTISGMLEGIQRSGQGEAVVITEKRDGALDRFEVKLPEQAPSQDRAAGLKELTAWVDPKTKLVQRMAFVMDGKMDGKRAEVNFTYGAPEIKDIYDVGVPRGAQVVDNRVKADADAFFARVEQRAAKGYGPHVAILSEYSLDTNGAIEPVGGLVLMSQAADGDALSNQYLVGKTDKGPNRAMRADLPEGWPAPTLDAVTKTLNGATPSQFLVVLDGKSGWQGSMMKPNEFHTNTLEGKYTQMIPNLLAQFTLGGMIWPTRERLGLFGAGVKASIELVKDNPEWIGLKIEQDIWTGKGLHGDPKNMSRTESFYVIDPTRDDMPVSYRYVSYPPEQKKPEVEITREYKQFAQLEGGAWYPVSWQTTTVSNTLDGKQSHHEQTSRLQIFPGETLGDEWFVNYAKDAKPVSR